MKVSLIKFILGGVPEAFLLTYVGLGLVGIKTSLQNYTKIVSCYFVGLIVFRGLINLYGMHSLVLCLFLALLFKFFLRINWKLSIIGALFGFVLLFLGEGLVYWGLINWLKVYMPDLVTSNDLLFFFTSFFAMQLPSLIVGGLIYLYDFSLYNPAGDEIAK